MSDQRLDGRQRCDGLQWLGGLTLVRPAQHEQPCARGHGLCIWRGDSDVRHRGGRHSTERWVFYFSAAGLLRAATCKVELAFGHRDYKTCANV